MARAGKNLKNSNRKIENMGKVVIHTRKHQVYRGFSKKEFINDSIRILDEDGKESTFSLQDLKALFFVKEFSGDPSYDEVLFLNKKEPSPWLWVHVEFEDGETIEGRIKNDKEIIMDSKGFFLWISDELANSDTVYVIKDAIRTFRVVS